MTKHPGVTGRKSGNRTGCDRKTSAADIAAAKPEFGREFEVNTGAVAAVDDAPSALALNKSPPKQRGPPKPSSDLDAYSIAQFCQRHGLSRGSYYNLRRKDLGPVEMHAMGRVLISKEAAEAWRRAREQITEETAA